MAYPEVTSKHVEDKMIRSSQHGFSKGKSCIPNLIAFSSGTTAWIDEGRTVVVVYLDFSKPFDTVLGQTIGQEAVGIS